MSNLHILVIHGPNLNLLGMREPGHYGTTTLVEINRSLIELGDRLGVEILTFQSNHEGEIVERIQRAGTPGSDEARIDGIIINPAAFTHTSIAIRDALLAVRLPFVEVHLSNIHGREDFRRRSLMADRACGVVAGFGAESYRLALRGLVHHLRHETTGD